MAFKLTPHAAQRLLERTSLSEVQATALLNAGRIVFAGHQHEDNRVHILFYSVADGRYFVAVANMRDEAVVTVLTSSQYRSRYGIIDEGRFLRAKAIASPGIPRTSRGPLLSCRYVGLDGAVHLRSLGRAEDGVSIASPEVLAGDLHFTNLLRLRCAAKGIEWVSVIDVSVRECAQDPPTCVPIELPGSDFLFALRWQGAGRLTASSQIRACNQPTHG